jgi:hypothetical protein
MAMSIYRTFSVNLSLSRVQEEVIYKDKQSHAQVPLFLYVPGCHFAIGTACPVGWPSHACRKPFLPRCTAPKGPKKHRFFQMSSLVNIYKPVAVSGHGVFDAKLHLTHDCTIFPLFLSFHLKTQTFFSKES